MTDNFDYEGYRRTHRAQLQEKFRTPDFAAFAEYYGAKVPNGLKSLYECKDLLAQVTPVEITDARGILEIRGFFPLTQEWIQANSCYHGKYFCFGSGLEAESFLISIARPEQIFVDHNSDGTDIEEIPLMSFEKILNQTMKLCQQL